MQRTESDLKLSEINTVIVGKQENVTTILKVVETARALNLREDEKNRALKKQYAAWDAKLKFIEKNYDYSSVAKKMDIEDL